MHLNRENPTNTHRTLKGLVSVNAWFQKHGDNSRYLTLHANVSFNQERIGGDIDCAVTFKLAVKQCRIIYINSLGGAFRIDEKSVSMPKPLNNAEIRKKITSKAGASGSGTLSLNRRSMDFGVSGSANSEHCQSVEETHSENRNLYGETWSMIDGNHSWSVNGDRLPDGRLDGAVFNAHEAPRLSVIDQRNEAQRVKDSESCMEPMASIIIRCKQEDIDIYEIKYKDPEKQRTFERSQHKKEKILAAKQVLKLALLQEGLSAGNPNDPYSDLQICDVQFEISDPSP